MKFNRLVFIRFSPKRCGRQKKGIFKCRCGVIKSIRMDGVRSGAVKSCGCLHKETAARLKFKHGHSTHSSCSQTYTSWLGMKSRCLNPNRENFKHYGGRGIKMCKRWDRFETFLKDMGKRPKNRSLDRINNDGNYTPSNCRWATQKMQVANQRRHLC